MHDGQHVYCERSRSRTERLIQAVIVVPEVPSPAASRMLLHLLVPLHPRRLLPAFNGRGKDLSAPTFGVPAGRCGSLGPAYGTPSCCT